MKTQSNNAPIADKRDIKRAKALALRGINSYRAENNLPPLLRVERLWWSLHGAEAMANYAENEERNAE